MILFSLCDIPFWLLWLLPLLLGILATWLYWKNKYASMVEDYTHKINSLNALSAALEEELKACKEKRASLESDLSLTKGRLKEKIDELDAFKADGHPETRGEAHFASAVSQMNEIQEEENHDKYGIHQKELQIIEGIGPKMEDVLNEHGISSLSDLSTKSPSDLRNILDSYEGKYKMINPTTWPQQAELGKQQKWDELIDLQKKLDAGVGDATQMTDSKLENLLINRGVLQKPEAQTSSTAKTSAFAAIKPENLQIIEGIGPKMESILKENGITTFSNLGNKSASEIQEVLDKYGDRYKIIKSGTWNTQAQLAAVGKWEELIDFQKKLDTGVDDAKNLTDSKLEKFLIKIGALKAFKQDDLTAIEGIGPATAKLLHENGIDTWKKLSEKTAEEIKEILNSAGSRFGLSDPTSWPKQAELAANGEFDKLREYQDYLDGGKG